MCQLCAVNLNNSALNSIFLSTQLTIDAIGNQDGTGFITTEKGGKINLWKSKLAADDIENLGSIIKDHVINSNPIIAHVRAASTGIKVERENAHPFVGKRFALAHNGRLYDKNEVVRDNQKKDADDTGIASDSLKFLSALELVAKENKSMTIVELLNKAMEEFKGKFAFLIYDSATEKHYAVRVIQQTSVLLRL